MRHVRSLARRRGRPLLRSGALVAQVLIEGLVDADYGGGSDPYLVFFSNPPEVSDSLCFELLWQKSSTAKL